MTADSTLRYYENHAEQFCQDTLNVDMSALYDHFLPNLPDGALILDAGCGSGRDSKAFKDRGYRVVAFDASLALVERARAHTGLPVAHRTFTEINETASYDGIWACASLLHIPEADLVSSFQRLWNALKPGGTFYLSFKYGDAERTQAARHFTDANETRLAKWLETITDIADVKTWITPDQRPGRNEQWLNALLHRKNQSLNKLVIGGENHPFLPQLSQAISHANEIDMTVACAC